MKKYVLASNNAHKVKEFKEILKDREILTLKDIGFFEDIEENGNTFLENSLIKAKTISEFLKSQGKDYVVLADDTGLCVNALKGEPGIYSARYSGIHGNEKANREKLLNNLKDKTDRSAYFECVVVEYFIDGEYLVGIGKTEGKIVEKEDGENGFGYDTIFFSNELNKTFGKSTAEEKNSVSHRAKAIKNLLKQEL